MQSKIEQPEFPNDESYFFHIASLGPFSSDPNGKEKPVRNPHYQIIWVSEGTGNCCIDLDEYSIVDNSICIVPPWHFIQLSPGHRLAGYVLSFNLDFLQLAIEGPGRPFFKEITGDLSRVKMVSLQADSRMLQILLADMTREFGSHLILRLEVLTGLFKIFLSYTKRLGMVVQQQKTSTYPMRLFNDFCTVLEKNYRTKKKVSDYASELSVTPSYMSDVIKKVTGRSASYHIQQRTVLEAKRLALFDNANLKGAAYALGFDDLSHFSKFFKMAAGMNFSEFKKQKVVGYSNH